ncbi:MAG TPA: LuxR C-terminal-related transcriptional regulator [Candidatus Limnocylindrales bacterium]|nr:LuxR C-terminal-related transcriptional regulator [Candidatus Limnocylindrales bacterium]
MRTRRCGRPRLDSRPDVSRLVTLTPRQVRVMGYMARGMSNAEIAKEVDIQEPAIAVWVMHLMELFELHRRADLVAAWRAHQEPGHPERVNLPDTIL